MCASRWDPRSRLPEPINRIQGPSLMTYLEVNSGLLVLVGFPGESDLLPRGDLIAFRHRGRGQARVDRKISLAVVDHNRRAITAVTAIEDDPAGADGPDGNCRIDADVDAGVRRQRPEPRVPHRAEGHENRARHRPGESPFQAAE